MCKIEKSGLTFGRRVTRTPRRSELGQGRFSRPFSARPVWMLIIKIINVMLVFLFDIQVFEIVGI